MFNRTSGNLEYRKLFVIVAEGAITEENYFKNRIFKSLKVTISFLPHQNKSAPEYLLKLAEKVIAKEKFISPYEVWIVMDKDKWKEDQLDKIYKWSLSRDNYGFALSNPKFEYWILLHFEDGNGINLPQDCEVRLKKYIPNYDKSFKFQNITRKQIDEAVERAKRRSGSQGNGYPKTTGTTVYKLAETILNNP